MESPPLRRDARSLGAWTARWPGMGGATLGRLAQGEVHFQADVVLDAQDPEDAGLGQFEGREREGGPGLEPDGAAADRARHERRGGEARGGERPLAQIVVPPGLVAPEAPEVPGARGCARAAPVSSNRSLACPGRSAASSAAAGHRHYGPFCDSAEVVHEAAPASPLRPG